MSQQDAADHNFLQPSFVVFIKLLSVLLYLIIPVLTTNYKVGYSLNSSLLLSLCPAHVKFFKLYFFMMWSLDFNCFFLILSIGAFLVSNFNKIFSLLTSSVMEFAVFFCNNTFFLLQVS